MTRPTLTVAARWRLQVGLLLLAIAMVCGLVTHYQVTHVKVHEVPARHAPA